MSDKVLITSALPYANGPLHFGHIAGAYLPGDCQARYQRLKGKQVLYVCGSDEYGVAITLSAERAGRSPQEHVDIFHEINKGFFDKLNFSFDHYSRTTSPLHQEPVHQFFNDLIENGYIESRESEQLYSEQDGRYLADRYVVGTCPSCGYERARGDECQKCGMSYEATDLKQPRSVLTHAPLTRKKTTHWFLLLEKFQERLLKFLEERDWKPHVKNFVRKFIEGLHARAITRDSDWGLPVPLPNTEGKVLYVWFDAPIGYITASMEWDPERWKEFWCDEKTSLIHFIGKDNVPFHAVIFPAMVMGQNQPYKLVDHLPANEFYKLEGRQFSKTDGWFIDLERFFSRYSTDQIRYMIAATAPETSDSEFTWHEFQLRCNAELLGKFGNFVNRTLVFAKRQCAGEIPDRGELEPEDEAFLAEVSRLTAEVGSAYEQFSLRAATRLIMELAQAGNVYFDSKAPWKDAKDPEKKGRLFTTIACCLECIKCLSLVSSPIIPETAQKVWEMLGQEGRLSAMQWDEVAAESLPVGQQMPEPKVLFSKVEDEMVQEELEHLKGMAEKAESEHQPAYVPLKEEIDFSQFQGLDLRVGVVESAEKVPKSKKLLKLQVDLGFEKRQVVSGIHEFYKPDEVVGRKVIVVANLKPAKIMGVESQGMVLAGNLGKELELAGVESLAAGAVVS